MKYQNIELHNVCDIISQAPQPGVGISRLPLSLHHQINQGAKNMSQLGSACEIRGNLKPGGKARIVLKALDDNCVPPTVLVYFGEFLYKAVVLEIKKETMILIEEAKNQKTMEHLYEKEGHAFHPSMVRILFPPIHPVHIISIEGDLSFPHRNHKPKMSLLCYGSSITHGASAVFPSGTYAAQCARLLGMDLLDLGFGGAAQMDPPIARHIAKRKDWDIAILEMGINVRGWSLEQFEKAVTDFVGIIASARPNRPVFCIDLFTNDWDLTPEINEKVLALRKIVRRVATGMDSAHVYHINGKTLLKDCRGLWTDLVHPNDHGMAEIGSKLAAFIRKKVPSFCG